MKNPNVSTSKTAGMSPTRTQKDRVPKAIETLECPSCGAEIGLSAALERQVGGQMQAMIDARVSARVAGERERMLAEADARIAAQSLELENALNENRLARGREAGLHKRERDIAAKESKLAVEFEERIQSELARIRSDERERVLAESSRLQADLKLEIDGLMAKLADAHATEAELLKTRAESDQLRIGMDLEIQKRVEEARQRDRSQLEQQRDLWVREALRESEEKHALAEREQSLQIERLNSQITRLQRSASSGTSELRGEELETLIRDRLRQAFPNDEFVDIPRGRTGGDILQTVNSHLTGTAGRILFEVKNTAQWGGRWAEKAIGDQQAARADLVVVVTMALPRFIDQFGYHAGVWITTPACVVALVVALRQGIIRFASMRSAAAARDAHLQGMFDYLISAEFRLQVQGVMGSISAMLSDLDSEQRAMTRIWTRRRRQIEQLSGNASAVIGNLEGATGRLMNLADEDPLAQIANQNDATGTQPRQVEMDLTEGEGEIP
ncbi:MAG: DUF2130 domain-containing protein [Candidatus Sumerlaeaceae bacterium]|nr:DUF2130 domain-containing protein [Candidatus Sumerlaeaceae bacterium]